MYYKIFLYDLKRTIFTKTTVLLLMMILVVTGYAIWQEGQLYKVLFMVSRGSDTTVQIVNYGSFISKLETVLSRLIQFTLGENPVDKSYFVNYCLINYLPLCGILLMLTYGYLSIVRDRERKIFSSLLPCPLRIQDYYFGKILSGMVYWFIFLAAYGIILLIYFMCIKGISLELIRALLSSLFIYWIYLDILWLLFVLISIKVKNIGNTCYWFLIFVIIFSFLLPLGISFISQNTYPDSPSIPYLSQQENRTITFGGKDREKVLEEVYEEVMIYREETFKYLTNGISLEDKLIVLSPVLVVSRLQKTFFWSELIDYRNFLRGLETSVQYLKVLCMIGYLIGINGVLLIIIIRVLKKVEVGDLL